MRVAREEGVLAVGLGEDILRVVQVAAGERLHRIQGRYIGSQIFDSQQNGWVSKNYGDGGIFSRT